MTDSILCEGHSRKALKWVIEFLSSPNWLWKWPLLICEEHFASSVDIKHVSWSSGRMFWVRWDCCHGDQFFGALIRRPDRQAPNTVRAGRTCKLNIILHHFCVLDLSFNNIKKIEGLNGLQKLEVLNLSNNRISLIENMDSLMELTVFCIANNKLHQLNNVTK